MFIRVPGILISKPIFTKIVKSINLRKLSHNDMYVVVSNF